MTAQHVPVNGHIGVLLRPARDLLRRKRLFSLGKGQQVRTSTPQGQVGAVDVGRRLHVHDGQGDQPFRRLSERIPDRTGGPFRAIRADHHSGRCGRRPGKFAYNHDWTFTMCSYVQRCRPEDGADKGAPAASADHEAGRLLRCVDESGRWLCDGGSPSPPPSPALAPGPAMPLPQGRPKFHDRLRPRLDRSVSPAGPGRLGQCGAASGAVTPRRSPSPGRTCLSSGHRLRRRRAVADGLSTCCLLLEQSWLPQYGSPLNQRGGVDLAAGVPELKLVLGLHPW